MSDTETPKLDALLTEPPVFDTPPKRHRVRNAIIGGVLVLATAGAGVAVGLTVGGGAGTPATCKTVVAQGNNMISAEIDMKTAEVNFLEASKSAINDLSYDDSYTYLDDMISAVRTWNQESKGPGDHFVNAAKSFHAASKTCK